MAATTVQLSCKALGIVNKEFTITHAEKLLQLEKKMGVQNWELSDKQFTLSANGFIERKHIRGNSKSKEQEPDSESTQ